MPYFSIIVPVYNRLGEVRDLLESLSKQTDKDFETVLVEDGSTERCEPAVREFESQVDVKYFIRKTKAAALPVTMAWSVPRENIFCSLTPTV